MTTQPTLGLELRRPHRPSLFGLNSANISPRDVLSGTAGAASVEVVWLERIYGLWRRLTYPALFRAVRPCDSRGVELLVFVGVGRFFFLTDARVPTLTRTPGENGFGWAVARFNLHAPLQAAGVSAQFPHGAAGVLPAFRSSTPPNQPQTPVPRFHPWLIIPPTSSRTRGRSPSSRRTSCRA